MGKETTNQSTIKSIKTIAGKDRRADDAASLIFINLDDTFEVLEKDDHKGNLIVLGYGQALEMISELVEDFEDFVTGSKGVMPGLLLTMIFKDAAIEFRFGEDDEYPVITDITLAKKGAEKLQSLTEERQEFVANSYIQNGN